MDKRVKKNFEIFEYTERLSEVVIYINFGIWERLEAFLSPIDCQF